MTHPVTVRPERPSDRAAIDAVVRRAYAAVPHSDHGEHRMVARLREGNAFVPGLSLVAACEADIVGHILLVRVGLAAANDPLLLALAPLSAVPEHQGRGVGAALVHAAHGRAARLGFAGIVLVGPPAYYRRFGYRPLGTTGLRLPFAVPEPQRLFLPLDEEALEGSAGVIAYPPGWLDH